MGRLNKQMTFIFVTCVCTCMAICGSGYLSADSSNGSIDSTETPKDSIGSEDDSVARGGHGGGHRGGGHRGGGHHGRHRSGGHHGRHHGGHHNRHYDHNNRRDWNHHGWNNGVGWGAAGLAAGYWAGSSEWGGHPGYYYDPNYYYDATTVPSVPYTQVVPATYETLPDYQYYEPTPVVIPVPAGN